MSSTDPVPAVPPRQLRNALGSYATGVAIVTASDGNGGFVGMTINSFASVSLDPPLVLWSVQLNSPSSAAFRQAQGFAVSILCTEHQALAKRFASNEEDRFADAPMRPGPSGLPVVENALTVFDCRTVARYAGGDHEILVGQVEALQAREDAEATALGFYRGKFLPVS